MVNKLEATTTKSNQADKKEEKQAAQVLTNSSGLMSKKISEETTTSSGRDDENESVSSYSSNQRDQSIEALSKSTGVVKKTDEENVRRTAEAVVAKSQTATNHTAMSSLEASPSRQHKKSQQKKGIKLKYLLEGSTSMDLLHNKSFSVRVYPKKLSKCLPDSYNWVVI